MTLAFAPRLLRVGASLTTIIAFTACGSANFQGESQKRKKAGADATPAGAPTEAASGGGDEVAISVDYEEVEDAGLNLVSNALSGYKADLIGGDACWGAQGSPITETAATPTLKVRKGAAGCIVEFKELHFKLPGLLVMQSSTPLKSNDASGTYVDYATADATTSLSIKVSATMSTSADSVIKLTGRTSKVVETETATVNEEIAVSAQGDVVAYPNVKIVGSPKTFRGAMRVTLNCIASAAAGSCTAAILPQAGGTASPQPFTQMDAAVAVLKGAAATGFPGSLTQPALDSLFAPDHKIGGVAQGFSNIAAPNIIAAPDSVEFKDLALPGVVAGNVPVLIVRYYEIVAPSTAKTYTYKAFRLGL